MKFRTAAAVSRRVLAVLAVSAVLRAAGPGDLTGTWKLNREASDDPKQKLEEAARNAPPPSSGGGGRGHGMHHGGGSAPSPDGGRPEHAAGAGADGPTLMKGLDVLTIEHHDPKLVITDSLGREHVLSTDGRKVEEEGARGKSVIEAQWKDGHVVVHWEPEHGPSVTEAYAVTADGTQLTVTMQLDAKGRMPAVTIRRVYDSASPATSTAPASPPTR